MFKLFSYIVWYFFVNVDNRGPAWVDGAAEPYVFNSTHSIKLPVPIEREGNVVCHELLIYMFPSRASIISKISPSFRKRPRGKLFIAGLERFVF